MTGAPTTAADILRGILQDYGLESLTDWAMGALARGLSETQVLQEMRDQPQFQQRFPAIKARQEAGLPPLSPAEYVEYERRVAQTLRDAGLPPNFYDTPDDFFALLMADKSAAEVQSTIQEGYLRVSQAAPEVRAAFGEWFGPDGENALAAFFLDPDRAKPALMQMAAEAQFGGTGRRFGVNVALDTAQAAVEAGVAAQAQQGFEQINEMKGYFDETISETTDLTAEKEGVEAVFGISGESSDKVRRRQETRAANFAGSSAAGTPGTSEDYMRQG